MKAGDISFLNPLGGGSRQFGIPVFQRQHGWTYKQSSQWPGDVQPLAETLSEQLADNKICAVPCRDGQTMGEENEVRVFGIQHIMGLEFEAVVFVGVNSSQPELFDKYLYVGTTRAATYLGMTCDGSLPTAFEPLRGMFAEHWMPA